MTERPIEIPTPAPMYDDPFWKPPAVAICRQDGITCTFAGVCSTPRQRLNHEDGLFRKTCPTFVKLSKKGR